MMVCCPVYVTAGVPELLMCAAGELKVNLPEEVREALTNAGSGVGTNGHGSVCHVLHMSALAMMDEVDVLSL